MSGRRGKRSDLKSNYDGHTNLSICGASAAVHQGPEVSGVHVGRQILPLNMEHEWVSPNISKMCELDLFVTLPKIIRIY